jgi:hypothetical protein
MTQRRINANQLVAYNLRRVREEWRFTQEQAADRLWEYTGERWSKATFSAAERSYAPGTRTRVFSANEILAFAAAFQRDLGYFFEPPADEDVVIVCDGDARKTISRKALVDLARPSDLASPHHANELRRIADALDPSPNRKEK